MKNYKKTSWREAARLNNRAIKLLFKEYPQFVLSRFFSIAAESLSPYVGIYISALLINELTGAKNPEKIRLYVFAALFSAAVLSLLIALLNRWKETQSACDYYNFEGIIIKKVLDMDYEICDDTKTSDLIHTVRENMNGGGWGFYRVILQLDELYKSVFTCFGGIALTVSLFIKKVPEGQGALEVLNSPFSVVLIVLLMITVCIAAPALEGKGRSYYAKYADMHNLGNRLFGFFGGLGHKKEIASDVRIYRQDIICENHNHSKTAIFASGGLFARLAVGPIGLCSAAGSAVSVAFTFIIYAFVCLKAWAGAFGLGAVTQYVASATKTASGVSGLVRAVGGVKNNAPFLALIFELLDIQNKMYRGTLTVEKRRDRKYQIEFKDVSFKYPGSETYALKHINMKFEIGKRLAVVGMNGSGKSTFIKLLCRLYDPTEGEILLNGIDIRKYDYKEYMNIFSVVFQDFNLFALKLGENVAAKSDYDKKAVEEALSKAGFSERLNDLPEGVETYLYKDYNKDGVNVSGGEAQKIAIARALYKDAPFLILDEPTAALDPVAEAQIYSKLNDIVGDKTAIYISHRLSSCKFCDEILVFEGGTVIQQGTHNSLVSEINGKYYELWHAQAQYYT